MTALWILAGYLVVAALIAGALLKLHQPRETWASAVLDVFIAAGWPLWWLALPFWVGSRLMVLALKRRLAEEAARQEAARAEEEARQEAERQEAERRAQAPSPWQDEACQRMASSRRPVGIVVLRGDQIRGNA